VNHLRSLLLLCGSLLVSGCELIASFDPSELDQNRTLGPTPLPTLDGAVPLLPDGSLRFDGALVRDDTGVPSDRDATPGDATAPTDASVSDASDGQVPDADLSAPDGAAGDAGQAEDAGDDADAEIRDAGPRDAAAPDLFADV